MIASFRVRMFAVLVVLSLLLALQQSGQTMVMGSLEPYIQWVVTRDYGVKDKLAQWWYNSRGTSPSALPAQAPALSRPVAEGEIARHYGWYWDPVTNKQQFNAGIILALPENTTVNPVASGQVEEIINKKEGRTVKVKHDGNLTASYGRLQEVLVKVGDQVDLDRPLGKTTDSFSFQLFNEQGAVNPEYIFQ
ncbi:MAG: peptidoglycan DD-metalloendopeptidase family protein [Methanomassiliicoccales archaeon]